MDNYFEFKNIFEPTTLYESQIAEPKGSSHISSESSQDHIVDSSSPCYSESESEVFSVLEESETTETVYQIIGKVTKRVNWKEYGWWVVEINDPEQIEKINKPSLISISGIFKFDNQDVLFNKNVLVEVTYNSKGFIQWKKNKIIKQV